MPETTGSAERFDIPELDGPFLFSRRPVDIPGDLRPAWRIGLVVLLLKKCCRQSRARFTQLHLLNWGTRSEENRLALEQAVAGDLELDSLLVRIEPSLNRAVDLAIGEGLVRRHSGDQIELTQNGHDLADAIERDDTMYGPERDFMRRIQKKVTAAFVSNLFG